MKETEVVVKNVHKTFKMGEINVKVLMGINLEIYKGELTVIQGESGSGKSTLLNLIGGIDTPSQGEVFFSNENIAALDEKKLTEFRRKNVGFVFQFYNLVSSLTAYENVEVSTDIADESIEPAEALRQVGLDDRMHHFPAELSGGQQQRVAIARALAKKPRLMLCDEPTGALDHNTSILVLNLIQELSKTLGTTIVMITHAPQISEIANRVIRIGDGIVLETYVNKKPRKAEEIDW